MIHHPLTCLGLAGSAPAQEARVGEGGHPFNVPPVPFPQHAHRFGPHFGPLRPLDVPPPGWHEQAIVLTIIVVMMIHTYRYT